MKKKKWLSIFLVVCLIGGIGGGIWYRQKRIDERRLSLVYIPKVVDKTNDFWKALILGTRMAAQEYNAAIEIKAPTEENDNSLYVYHKYEQEFLHPFQLHRQSPEGLHFHPS